MSAQPRPLAEFSSLALIRTLGVVATVCGVLIVLAYEWTLPAVNANKRRLVEQTVLKVAPGAVTSREFQVGSDGAAPLLFAGYDAAGHLKAIAIEGSARGYSDVVRVLYGYDPWCRCIVGFAVLQMRETPGIGDRIAFDPDFLANFRALDVQLGADGKALAHTVVAVRHGRKANAWEVDAISGATITTRAVARAINDSAQAVLPRLAPELERIKRGSDETRAAR